MKGRRQGDASGAGKLGRSAQRRRTVKWDGRRVSKTSSVSSNFSKRDDSNRSGFPTETLTPTYDGGRSTLVLGSDYEDVRPFMERFGRFLRMYRSYKKEEIDIYSSSNKNKRIDEYFNPNFLKDTREYNNAPEEFKRAADATIDGLVKLNIAEDIGESAGYVANAYKGLETIAEIYKQAKNGEVEKTYLKAKVDNYCLDIGEMLKVSRKKEKKVKKPPEEAYVSNGKDVVVIGKQDLNYYDAIVIGWDAEAVKGVLRERGFTIEGSKISDGYELVQCWIERRSSDIGRILRDGNLNVKNICSGDDIGVYNLGSSKRLDSPSSMLSYAKKFI